MEVQGEEKTRCDFIHISYMAWPLERFITSIVSWCHLTRRPLVPFKMGTWMNLIRQEGWSLHPWGYFNRIIFQYWNIHQRSGEISILGDISMESGCCPRKESWWPCLNHRGELHILQKSFPTDPMNGCRMTGRERCGRKITLPYWNKKGTNSLHTFCIVILFNSFAGENILQNRGEDET